MENNDQCHYLPGEETEHGGHHKVPLTLAPVSSPLLPTCAGDVQPAWACVHIGDMDAKPQLGPATLPGRRHLNRQARWELQLEQRGARRRGLELGKWHSWPSEKADKTSDVLFSSSYCFPSALLLVR